MERWEGAMALKRRASIGEAPVSDREFEMLLRRASEILKPARPHLLKKVPLNRRSSASAA
jgi:hypothetical protein